MARVDGFATRLQIVSRASSGRIGESEAELGAIGAWGCRDVSGAPRTSSLSTCNMRSSMLERPFRIDCLVSGGSVRAAATMGAWVFWSRCQREANAP